MHVSVVVVVVVVVVVEDEEDSVTLPANGYFALTAPLISFIVTAAFVPHTTREKSFLMFGLVQSISVTTEIYAPAAML